MKYATRWALIVAKFLHRYHGIRRQFAKDMEDKQVLLRIEADQQAAAELGINGTPTIIIDGRQLRPEVTNPEGIRKAIEYMMSKKLSAAP